VDRPRPEARACQHAVELGRGVEPDRVGARRSPAIVVAQLLDLVQEAAVRVEVALEAQRAAIRERPLLVPIRASASAWRPWPQPASRISAPAAQPASRAAPSASRSDSASVRSASAVRRYSGSSKNREAARPRKL